MFEKNFPKLCNEIAQEINKSIEKDEKALILATDVDSIGCSTIMYYLMTH